jgi:excinuclease ABC subunit B
MAETQAHMRRAAQALEFEAAAVFRDRLQLLKEMDLGLKLPSRALLEAVETPKGPSHKTRRIRRLG